MHNSSIMVVFLKKKFFSRQNMGFWKRNRKVFSFDAIFRILQTFVSFRLLLFNVSSLILNAEYIPELTGVSFQYWL